METLITLEMIRSFENDLQNLAESILDRIGVGHLSPQQVTSVRDGAGAGAGYNLCHYNDDLVDALHIDGPQYAKDKKEMLKQISLLTLTIMHLAAIEGGGHIRYTETVSALFTNPDNFSERSLRWEDGLLDVACDWFKSETVASEVALAVKRSTFKTCTERTSYSFLRCALAIKPLEARLVSDMYGAEAASVHWVAFCARDGKDMCSDANLLWARSRFNSMAKKHLHIMLHGIRHLWIGLTTRVTDTFVDKQTDSFRHTVLNHSARQSMHDQRTERDRYAGEAGSIRGHETIDRRLFRRLSEHFNDAVFGSSFRKETAATKAISEPIAASIQFTSSYFQSNPIGDEDVVFTSSDQSFGGDDDADVLPDNKVEPQVEQVHDDADVPLILDEEANQSDADAARTPHAFDSDLLALSLPVPHRGASRPGMLPMQSGVLDTSTARIRNGHIDRDLVMEGSLESYDNVPDQQKSFSASSSDSVQNIAIDLNCSNTSALSDSPSSSYMQPLPPHDVVLPPSAPAILRNEVLSVAAASINKSQKVLLAQYPGFGKTTFVLSLIEQGGIIFMFVPTLELQKQVLRDLQKRSAPSVSLHDVLSCGETLPIVNMYSAVVGIFDHIPYAYRFVRTALELGKVTRIVIDEVHQILQDSSYRFNFNRAWELGSRLEAAAIPWLLVSASLRVDEEQTLCRALNIKSIDCVLRGQARPAGVSFKIVHCASFADACKKAAQHSIDIMFVKTYKEARQVVASVPEIKKFWCSKLRDDEKSDALLELAKGRPIVATYGLSVGVNLSYGSRPVQNVALFGLPYSASSFVQAAGRIRRGGTVLVLAWDLHKTAACVEPTAQVELATLLLTDDVDGIYDLFSPSSSTSPVSIPDEEATYNEIHEDACSVSAMDMDEEELARTCGICCGPHVTNRCPELHGKCFSCGLSGHGTKICKLKNDIPGVPNGFCSRCRLPLFEVAGVWVHSEDELGQDCKRTALADLGKMLLLSGKVSGVLFGPPSYIDRLKWAFQGKGPNIVMILACVARDQGLGCVAPDHHAPPTVQKKAGVDDTSGLQRIRCIK